VFRNGVARESFGAGETERVRDYLLAVFSDAIPESMNYPDGPPIVESFECEKIYGSV
jgi:hypothetical protein